MPFSLDSIKGQRILVVGDLIADEYLYGKTSRVSREAPVLILKYRERRLVPGGAGNTAMNLRSLGVNASLLAVVGDDPLGQELLEVVTSHGMDGSSIITAPGEVTTAKTRILAGGHQATYQQVIRMDREESIAQRPALIAQLTERFRALAETVDAIIVSDYGLGVVSPAMIAAINGLAPQLKVPLTVDSRFALLDFSHVTAVTPNESEVEETLAFPIRDDAGRLREAGKRLLAAIDAKSVLITRGKNGMALFTGEGGVLEIPVFGGDEVADVTGAGDTVIATFTAALAAGADFATAARISNVAGGLVVMKSGTATVSLEELAKAMDSKGE